MDVFIYHENYSATENPEAFCRPAEEGCNDAHSEVRGSQTRIFLHLVVSDLGEKSGFWGRVERLWAVPSALRVTRFADRHGRPT